MKTHKKDNSITIDDHLPGHEGPPERCHGVAELLWGEQAGVQRLQHRPGDVDFLRGEIRQETEVNVGYQEGQHFSARAKAANWACALP